MASRVFVDISPLRRFPQYRRLWVGYAIRQMGAQLTVTTVIYQVYLISHHSNLAVGLISAAQVGPGIVAPMIGGAIADAIDRRRLLMITAVLMAGSTTCLALNSIGNHPMLWVLYVMSAVTWGLNGIDGPTRQAVQMTLVDRDSIIAANALRQLLQQVATVVGPSLAGALIAVFAHNIDLVYWIDVASTIAAFQAVARLQPLPPSSGGRKFGLSSIAEGFRFVASKRVIASCFLADINATLLGLPKSLFPAMAFNHFHGGARTYGLLASAPAFGAMLGAFLSGWVNHVRFQGRAVLVSITIWGIAIAIFGITPWLGLGLVMLAIAGWADVCSATLRNSIIQTEAPDELRGRVSSLQTVSVQTGQLGNAEAGLVAYLSNTEISIVSGGLGCVLGVGLIAKFVPSFWRYQLHPPGEPEEEGAGQRTG